METTTPGTEPVQNGTDQNPPPAEEKIDEVSIQIACHAFNF